MISETFTLACGSPGRTHQFSAHRFGVGLAGPKAYLQAGLHADEAPGMLVLQVLMRELQALEAQGQLRGEITVVPMANPIGLGQFIQGQQFGRFALADGLNFNRSFADLTPKALERLQGHAWSADASANNAALRAALLQACKDLQPESETDALRKLLLQLALPNDTVLDLHCDGESVMHLYTSTSMVSDCAPLASLLGAQAVLIADVSGDNPFDEALARPWWEAARALPHVPFAPGCLSVTVELRGEADVRDDLAEQDAKALIAFLALRGSIAAQPAAAITAAPAATPLAGVEPLLAPISGVIVFERNPGAQIQAGERVARILNPATGEQRDVCASRPGVLYARVAQRTILAGRRVAKVAGSEAFRSGVLLSP